MKNPIKFTSINTVYIDLLPHFKLCFTYFINNSLKNPDTEITEDEEEEEEDILAVSIGNYLAALQVNAIRAEHVLQDTKAVVQQVEDCKFQNHFGT